MIPLDKIITSLSIFVHADFLAAFTQKFSIKIRQGPKYFGPRDRHVHDAMAEARAMGWFDLSSSTMQLTLALSAGLGLGVVVGVLFAGGRRRLTAPRALGSLPQVAMVT